MCLKLDGKEIFINNLSLDKVEIGLDLFAQGRAFEIKKKLKPSMFSKLFGWILWYNQSLEVTPLADARGAPQL